MQILTLFRSLRMFKFCTRPQERERKNTRREEKVNFISEIPTSDIGRAFIHRDKICIKKGLTIQIPTLSKWSKI